SSTYGFKIISNNHNYEPPADAISSTYLRTQTQREFGYAALETIIEERSKAGGTTAREIVRQIYIDFTSKRLQEGRYGALTSTQAFISLLEQDLEVFYHNIYRRPDRKLCRFFWTYTHCIEDWKRSPELLMIDCIYKVNRFNLPLFQVTETTPLHTNFSAGFGLCDREDADIFT
ncbi:hypothetical protein B0J13DRAFT_552801, partial [Dactylonectria estremocensis]